MKSNTVDQEESFIRRFSFGYSHSQILRHRFLLVLDFIVLFIFLRVFLCVCFVDYSTYKR